MERSIPSARLDESGDGSVPDISARAKPPRGALLFLEDRLYFPADGVQLPRPVAANSGCLTAALFLSLLDLQNPHAYNPDMGAVVKFDARRELTPGIPRETAAKAIRAWASGFSLADLSLLLTLDEKQVVDLMETDEWRTLREELKFAIEADLVAASTRVTASTLKELHERVIHGEPLVDKMGVPLLDAHGDPLCRRLSTRDLATVTTTVINAKASLERTGAAPPDEADHDRLTLKELAEALKKVARSTRYDHAKEITPE